METVAAVKEVVRTGIDAVPQLRLYLFPNIGEAFLKHLNLAEQSIVGTAFCIDHEEGCEILRRKAREGLQIRIMLDHGQWVKTGSARMPDQVQSLINYGVVIKTRRLEERGMFASHHAKTWAIDGQVYLGGSANLTNNACKSEEHLIVIRDQEFLQEHLNWFENLWSNPQAFVLTRGRGS